MADKVDIFNDALIFVGDDVILDPAGSEERTLICAASFDQARDETMQLHPWNECMVRAGLAADGATPEYGFALQYTLPTDPFCLRVWRFEDGAVIAIREGRKLFTDTGAPLNILYIARITDVAEWGPLLAHAIAMRLAWKVAFRLTGETAVEDRAEKAFEKALATGRAADAQEGTPEDEPESDFLGSRI